MNIKVLALSSAFIIAPVIGYAQDATTTETPAIATPDAQNPQAPVEGENSFTEEQARERIEEAGFTNVTGLKLSESGVWEGSATKGADNITVQLDYQGNVTTKPM